MLTEANDRPEDRNDAQAARHGITFVGLRHERAQHIVLMCERIPACRTCGLFNNLLQVFALVAALGEEGCQLRLLYIFMSVELEKLPNL
jgi:hypothetical protein